MKIKVGNREIDLEKALPITIGDLRKLKKAGVSYPSTFDVRDPDHVSIFLLHFCKKVDVGITEEEVDTLELTDILNIIHFLVRTKEELERPTSGESIALPTTTVGDPAT